MKSNNNIAKAIYITGAFSLFLVIYYLQATNSVAFSWLEYLLPVGLLIGGFRFTDK